MGQSKPKLEPLFRTRGTGHVKCRSEQVVSYFEFLIARTTKMTAASAATKISKCLSETKKIMELCSYAALSALTARRLQNESSHYPGSRDVRKLSAGILQVQRGNQG